MATSHRIRIAYLLCDVGAPLLLFISCVQALCQNSSSTYYKYPPDCHGLNCLYQIRWRYKPVDDSVEFIVATNQTDRWTGIMFANERPLAAARNGDGILGWIENYDKYVIMDAFLPNFSQAISDPQQSVDKVEASAIKQGAKFIFTRRRNTRDDRDVSFADDAPCPYFVYPVYGGSVDAAGRPTVIQADENELKMSDERVCVRPCPGPGPAPVAASRPSTTSPPPPRPASSQTPRPQPTTTARPSTSSTTTTTTSTTTSTTPKPTTTSTSTTTTTTSTTTTTTTTTTPAPPTTTTLAPPTTLLAAPATTATSTLAQPATAAQPSCGGRWAHPPNCRFRTSTSPREVFTYLQTPVEALARLEQLPLDQSDCTYYAQWHYQEPSDSIEFVIQTRTRNRWTGIGFSNSTRMANSDAIIGLIEEHSGRHFIMDTWLRDHVMPEIDQQQDIRHTSGKRENGTTTLRFSRKRITNDSLDFQFTDDSCAYFFFPTQGGSFNAISKRMLKHETVPSVSASRICVRQCASQPHLTPSRPPASGAVDRSLAAAAANAAAGVIEATHSSSKSLNTNPLLVQQADDAAAAKAASSTSAPPTSVLQSAATTTTSTSTTSTTTRAPDAGANSPPAPDQANEPQPQPQPPTTNQLDDLSAELDGSSSPVHSAPNSPNSLKEPTQAGAGHRFAFLAEPSLRWLAGIAAVATLVAMIVFQACFTVYKNKQAHKQALYRQSAYKQNAYLRGAYLADHAAGATDQQVSSAVAAAAANSSAAAAAAQRHLSSHRSGAHHPISVQHYRDHNQSSTASEETQTASLRNSESKLSAIGQHHHQSAHQLAAADHLPPPTGAMARGAHQPETSSPHYSYARARAQALAQAQARAHLRARAHMHQHQHSHQHPHQHQHSHQHPYQQHPRQQHLHDVEDDDDEPQLQPQVPQPAAHHSHPHHHHQHHHNHHHRRHHLHPHPHQHPHPHTHALSHSHQHLHQPQHHALQQQQVHQSSHHLYHQHHRRHQQQQHVPSSPELSDMTSVYSSE